MPENLSIKIRPAKILLVEDDPGYLALLTLRLGRAGFDVLTADSGEAAMALFSETPVPVVVSDLVMPKACGITLLKFVKQTAPDTEVILLSGKGSIEQAVEAMRVGAFDFLVKPVEDGKLEALVNYCFETIERKKQGKNGQEKESEAAPDQSHPGLNLESIAEQFSMTQSETGVIALVLKGKTDQEIADARFISYHTVKKHLQNIFKKMRVKSRIELILQIK